MKLLQTFWQPVVVLAMGVVSTGLVTAQEVPAEKASAAKPAKAAKTTRPRGTAYVRVLHAIPGGQNVDVYVDGKKTLNDVAFKSLSDYMLVPSGQRSFAIHAVGKTEALASQKKAVTAEKYYTVAAVTNEGKPAFVVQNESTGKIAENKAHIRMINLAQGAPSVDITIPAKRKNATGYSKLATGLLLNKSRARGLAPGTYNVQVRTGDKMVKEVNGVQIESGKRYSIFAVGKVDDALEILVKPAATR